jgi:hypothetical protein
MSDERKQLKMKKIVRISFLNHDNHTHEPKKYL